MPSHNAQRTSHLLEPSSSRFDRIQARALPGFPRSRAPRKSPPRNAIASAAFTSPCTSPTGMPPRPDRMPSSTSPPFPTGGEWDHPPLQLRRWARRPTPPQAKKTKPPRTHTPVGKAEFEVWVLTKGGRGSVQHCRLYRTVVHAHHFGDDTSEPWVRVRGNRYNFGTIAYPR